jgi:hypothetical protein
MGLIDLKTDLKSLKYGNDKRGGGSSNQPYITTPIPDGFAPTSPDFLLRNGYLNPVSSLRDVSRLTKWFTDTKSPNGILFTAKQQLLERQNVKVPGGLNRVYNPVGTIAQAGVLSTGYHLNKQGLNPFATGYFKGGREGYFYSTLAGSNVDDGVNGGENRLTLLYTSKITGKSLGTFDINPFGISGPNDQINILSYSGGPGSVLGIGNTNIRFAGSGERERTNNLITFNDALSIFKRFDPTSIEVITPTTNITPAKNGGSTTLLALNNTYNPRISNKGVGIAGDFNRETTYQTSYTEYKSIFPKTDPNGFYAVDEINASRILVSESIEDYKNSDLIKFYFEIINNDTIGDTNNAFLFFRAYLNNFGDGFKAEWQSYKYVGRGENFYKYSGFSRDISLSFTIYAHSRAEMLPIYQKLNRLVGTTAPDYSDIGLMRGNFIKMTVGDYLLDVPGIIQNINLKPSFEAGWDINRKEDGTPFKPEENSQDGDEFVGQLPRLIEVDLQFTPIHTFTPQIGENFIRNI